MVRCLHGRLGKNGKTNSPTQHLRSWLILYFHCCVQVRNVWKCVSLRALAQWTSFLCTLLAWKTSGVQAMWLILPRKKGDEGAGKPCCRQDITDCKPVEGYKPFTFLIDQQPPKSRWRWVMQAVGGWEQDGGMGVAACTLRRLQWPWRINRTRFKNCSQCKFRSLEAQV